MEKWLLELLGGVEPPEGAEPSLLRGTMFSEGDVGTCEWNTEVNKKLLKFTNDRRTIEWSLRNYKKQEMPIAWLPAMTRLRLHSGHYRWDFTIEEMDSAQIAVGILLLFNFGPDWGFYGYLGFSPNAWAYDPSTGDVVTATRSIQGGLPRFEDGNTGVVTVDLNVPRDGEGTATFVVAGVESQPVPLPSSSVILPAACLLKEGQRVTLGEVKRLPEGGAAH